MKARKGSIEPGDRLLTVEEIAKRTGLAKRWFRGRRLPFVVRVSARRVRYSELGLENWLRQREGAQKAAPERSSQTITTKSGSTIRITIEVNS